MQLTMPFALNNVIIAPKSQNYVKLLLNFRYNSLVEYWKFSIYFAVVFVLFKVGFVRFTGCGRSNALFII